MFVADGQLLPIWLAFVVQVSLSCAAAIVFSRRGPRLALAWIFGGCLPVVAFFTVPEPPVARFILVTGAMLAVFHLYDLSRAPDWWSTGWRLLFMMTPFDTRRLTPAARTLRGSLLVALVSWAALAGACLWTVVTYAPDPGTDRWWVRWPLGLVGFYASVESLSAFIKQSWLLLGFKTPPLHRAPMLARTVQEFWGERWNLEVHRWLHTHIFSPLAKRRRPTLGLAAAFIASMLLHVILMLAAVGWRMAGLWAAYFILQGMIVIVERRLRVRRWRPVLARTWTITWMVLSSPLFVEPILRVVPG